MSGLLSRLKDFSTPPMPAAPTIDRFEDDLPFFAEPSEPPVDLDAEREEAFERGRAQATAELTEKYEEEARVMALVHDRELQELRRTYDEEFATAFKAGMEKIAVELAAMISDRTAVAMAPVMTEALAESAAQALAALLRETIGEGGAATILVRGPLQLFEVLQAEMGEASEMLRHQETDDIDLAVEIDDGVLVTRLSAWAAGLRKVLE